MLMLTLGKHYSGQLAPPLPTDSATSRQSATAAWQAWPSRSLLREQQLLENAQRSSMLDWNVSGNDRKYGDRLPRWWMAKAGWRKEKGETPKFAIPCTVDSGAAAAVANERQEDELGTTKLRDDGFLPVSVNRGHCITFPSQKGPRSLLPATWYTSLLISNTTNIVRNV